MKVLLSVVLCLHVLCPVVEPALDISELGPKFGALVATLHEACLQKSKVDESTIEQVKKGIFNDSDNRFKKYVTCIWTDSTALNDDGSLNFDVINDLLPPKYRKTLVPMIKRCFGEASKEKTLEEIVYSATKCSYKADPANFVMFRK